MLTYAALTHHTHAPAQCAQRFAAARDIDVASRGLLGGACVLEAGQDAC
jgi:hypothetical protein